MPVCRQYNVCVCLCVKKKLDSRRGKIFHNLSIRLLIAVLCFTRQVIRCRHGFWPHVLTIAMAVIANLFLIALPIGQGSKVLAAITTGYLFNVFFIKINLNID